MKKLLTISAAVILSIFMMIGCSKNLPTSPVAATTDNASASNNEGIIPGSYIVVFKDSPDFKGIDGTYDERVEVMTAYVSDFLKSLNIDKKQIGYVYVDAVHGFSANLTPDEVEVLQKDLRVAYIEPDRKVRLNYKIESIDEGQKSQVTPWGITRVGGAVVYTGTRRAWILDTGIQSNHPDLNVDISRSRSFVTGQTYEDGNGHGTHVAGTVAARHNTIGVIGVAAGAPVVAVKVLANDGSGTYSAIIAGVDYVRVNAPAGDVANLSLGGPASTTLDNAVLNLANKGVWTVIAAGNDYRNANNYSPARVNGTYIYTVSAFDSNNRFASFSNYANPPIDWSAPGVSIYSTWKGSTYATISGTSMATPHVAGIRLFTTPVSYGTVTGDPDGVPDRRAGR